MAEKQTKQNRQNKQKTVHNTQPHCLIEKQITSEPAKKAYRRYFDVTADALFRLAFNVRIYGTDEMASKLEEMVQSNIGDVAKALSEERTRLKKLMKDNGINANVSFPNSIKIQAKISSPSAGQLLGVICELDAVVGDITNLWLHGILDNRQYTQGVYKCQRQVIKMTGRLRQFWFDARKLMAENGAEGLEEETPIVEPDDVAEAPKARAKKTVAPKVVDIPVSVEPTLPLEEAGTLKVAGESK